MGLNRYIPVLLCVDFKLLPGGNEKRRQTAKLKSPPNVPHNYMVLVKFTPYNRKMIDFVNLTTKNLISD